MLCEIRFCTRDRRAPSKTNEWKLQQFLDLEFTTVGSSMARNCQFIHRLIPAVSMFVFLLIACSRTSSAQWMTLPGAVQPLENYAAEDFQNRGLLYRMQVGQAGLFRNCDEEPCKRYSPYINWDHRPCQPQYRLVTDMIGDWNRKVERLMGGAGACADCQPVDSHTSGYTAGDSRVASQSRAAESIASQRGLQTTAPGASEDDRRVTAESGVSMKGLESPSKPSSGSSATSTARVAQSDSNNRGLNSLESSSRKSSRR
jgi:hypothetical protein